MNIIKYVLLLKPNIQLQTFMKVIFFINLSSMKNLKLTYILNKFIQYDAVPKSI